jgi:hypothetical protein
LHPQFDPSENEHGGQAHEFVQNRLFADRDLLELHDKSTSFFDPDDAAVGVTLFSTHLRGAPFAQPVDDVGRLDFSDEALC